jgi:hypothetical protein
MKCISCETEINPKWKHAIDINVCPFCGEHIMEEHLKNCVAALAKAMDDMSKYQEQLDDWLLSNHNYIKTDSPNLINFVSKEDAIATFRLAEEKARPASKEAASEEPQTFVKKIKVPDGKGGVTVEEVIVEKRQSEEQTNGFFDRAEVLKGAGKTSGKAPKTPDEPEEPKSVAEKTRNLKARVAEIKKAGVAAIEENGMASMIDPSMLADADPDAVAALQAAIEGSDIVASGLPPSSDGDDDEIPSIVQNMASRALQKGGSNGANERDMQTLQEMQNKVRNAQKRLSSGKGSFSRG